MRILVLLATTLLVVGCSTNPTPYFEIGIGYQLDGMTDYWLQTDRDWTCNNNDTFHGEFGLEFDHQLTVGYHHQSATSCGGPFNSHPEIYRDEILVTKRWGGR